MTEWIPMYTLPNVDMREEVEVEGLALVSADDSRVKELAAKHEHFKIYLGRFTTEFSKPVTPSIILRKSDSTELLRSAEALAGFRDVVAISTIPYSWANALRFGNNQGIRYSNWFSFYPWMLDKNYDHLVMQSMAQLALHNVKEMKAQSTAGLSPIMVTSDMIDRPLLEELLKRWITRYTTETPTWEDTALFRSLNMALSAAALPGNVEVTIYDIGRSIALWVSAFEILAHPGTNVGYQQIYELLDSVEWKLTICTDPIYEPLGWKQSAPRRSLPIWMYGEMSRARHDFIHGNKLKSLIVLPAKQSLYMYTSLLYRMALTGFLKSEMPILPKIEGETEYEHFFRQRGRYGRFQADIEAGLSTILYTPEEYRNRGRAT